MKRLFSILFCLALLGCQQQEDVSMPDNLVPRDKMVQILADIHVMESLIETNANYPDTAVMIYNKQHKLILEKHDVTQQDFYKTYRFYGANLEEMDKLYEIILDTLSVREAKLSSKSGVPIGREPQNNVIDSFENKREPLKSKLTRPKRMTDMPVQQQLQ